MERKVYLVNKEAQGAAFHSLILPEVCARLGEPALFLVGALEENRVVGAAVMELETGRARLLSIAVAEGQRRQGVGSALLRQCVRSLYLTSIQSLYAVTAGEEQEAAALFASFGMETEDSGGIYYHFRLGDVADLSALRGKGSSIALGEVPDVLVRAYMHKSFPADPSLGQQSLFDPKISRVFLHRREISACLLAERGENSISISWLSSDGTEKAAVRDMLRDALHTAVKCCPPETQVDFAAYTPSVVHLADALLGKAAEKQSIQQWLLADRRFRLTDTTPKGWEEDTYAG